MKLEFSRKIFHRYSKTKFHKNMSLGAEMFHADGRTDGYTAMTKLIVVFATLRKRLKLGPYLRENIELNYKNKLVKDV